MSLRLTWNLVRAAEKERWYLVDDLNTPFIVWKRGRRDIACHLASVFANADGTVTSLGFVV